MGADAVVVDAVVVDAVVDAHCACERWVIDVNVRDRTSPAATCLVARIILAIGLCFDVRVSPGALKEVEHKY